MNWLTEGDPVSRLVAALLLAMSVASWVVIFWKAWSLPRAASQLRRSTAAFWQAASWQDAHQQLQHFDPDRLLLPLLDATAEQQPGTLAAAGNRSQQLTRGLRDALHGVQHRLQFGQVLLATVGATAPFVGLLGTVWGIYHALTGMASVGQIIIDQIGGPVGEALIMTAAGLAVAIPAVLGYNILGRRVQRLEAELEGFALDLRDWLASPEAGATSTIQTKP